MGKKDKKKQKYKQKQKQKTTPTLSEQQLGDLAIQASEIHLLLNDNPEAIKKTKDFAYLLSTKWLKQWKDYVGYDIMFEDKKETNKTPGKNRPKPPNTNLTDSNAQYIEIPKQLEQQYGFLNIVINDKLQMDQDYIPITYELWLRLNSLYGPGVQIKRPTRYNQSYVDGSLLNCDIVLVNYNADDFHSKIQQSKSIKSVENIISKYKIQFGKRWRLEDLTTFLQKLCIVKYHTDSVTLWLMENWIGVKDIQDNFLKSAKNKKYDIYGFKLEEDDYGELDLEDFIKTQYTILLEIGETRATTRPNPTPPEGFCEECLKKKELAYHCECRHRYYCCRSCQSDDQLFHFKSCSLAFVATDDEAYMKKKVSGASGLSKCGLVNLGNTCYMNTSIQAFLGLGFIVDYLTENLFRDCLSKKEMHSHMFLEKLSKTFKIMAEQTSMGAIEPWDLKDQINYFLRPFQGYKQHDANDFLTALLTTINDCLEVPPQEAYHPVIRDNLVGLFDSLITCPDCSFQVKNIQIFTQLSLPIKPKIFKNVYHYAVFQNPFLCQYGKAEMKGTLTAIKHELGVPNSCAVFVGAENQSRLNRVNEDEGTEEVLKKLKKQLLFYPYLKANNDHIILTANFINIKVLSGVNTKANTGYPFPIATQNKGTIGHLFIDLLRTLSLVDPQTSETLKQIQSKYEQLQKTPKLLEEQLETLTETTEVSLNNQTPTNSPLHSQPDPKPTAQEIPAGLQQLDSSLQELTQTLTAILSALDLQVFIEDTKKRKNICNFCQKKCEGCPLLPNFKTPLAQLLAPKANECQLYLKLSSKPELSRTKHDLTSSGEASLQDCLALFSQPQTLDTDNAWYCSQCMDMKLANKQLQVLRFPKYLILHLNRFKNGAKGKVKNHEPIEYEEYQLFGGNRYRLSSAIVHEGSIETGHYWSICRRNNHFYTFNDHKISKTDRIANKNAYILCYELEIPHPQTTHSQQL